MPLLSYRFRVILDDKIDPESIFTKNVENVIADYKNKTLEVTVRQPCSDENMSQIVSYLCSTDSSIIRVEALAGNADPEFANEYISCSVEKHRFALGYGISDAAKHELKFKYETFYTTKCTKKEKENGID